MKREPSLFDITFDHTGAGRGVIMKKARITFPGERLRVEGAVETYEINYFGDIECVIDIKVRTDSGTFNIRHTNKGNDLFIAKHFRDMDLPINELTEADKTFARFVLGRIPLISKKDFQYLTHQLWCFAQKAQGRDIAGSYRLELIRSEQEPKGFQFMNSEVFYNYIPAYDWIITNPDTGTIFRFGVNIADSK